MRIHGDLSKSNIDFRGQIGATSEKSLILSGFHLTEWKDRRQIGIVSHFARFKPAGPRCRPFWTANIDLTNWLCLVFSF
jgi:hypothetical protein